MQEYSRNLQHLRLRLESDLKACKANRCIPAQELLRPSADTGSTPVVEVLPCRGIPRLLEECGDVIGGSGEKGKYPECVVVVRDEETDCLYSARRVYAPVGEHVGGCRLTSAPVPKIPATPDKVVESRCCLQRQDMPFTSPPASVPPLADVPTTSPAKAAIRRSVSGPSRESVSPGNGASLGIGVQRSSSAAYPISAGRTDSSMHSSGISTPGLASVHEAGSICGSLTPQRSVRANSQLPVAVHAVAKRSTNSFGSTCVMRRASLVPRVHSPTTGSPMPSSQRSLSAAPMLSSRSHSPFPRSPEPPPPTAPRLRPGLQWSSAPFRMVNAISKAPHVHAGLPLFAGPSDRALTPTPLPAPPPLVPLDALVGMLAVSAPSDAGTRAVPPAGSPAADPDFLRRSLTSTKGGVHAYGGQLEVSDDLNQQFSIGWLGETLHRSPKLVPPWLMGNVANETSLKASRVGPPQVLGSSNYCGLPPDVAMPQAHTHSLNQSILLAPWALADHCVIAQDHLLKPGHTWAPVRGQSTLGMVPSASSSHLRLPRAGSPMRGAETSVSVLSTGGTTTAYPSSYPASPQTDASTHFGFGGSAGHCCHLPRAAWQNTRLESEDGRSSCVQCSTPPPSSHVVGSMDFTDRCPPTQFRHQGSAEVQYPESFDSADPTWLKPPFGKQHQLS